MQRLILLLLAGFGLNSWALASAPIDLKEISSVQVNAMLKGPQFDPGDKVFVESKIQFQKDVIALDLPPNLKIQIPENLLQDVTFVMSHAYFSVPIPIDQIGSANFWSFSNLGKLIKEYHLTETKVYRDGADGSLSVPIGFSFGLAPSAMVCKTQVRFEEKGDGPGRDSGSHESWGKPDWTVYQMNSDCNVAFQGVLAVSSFYSLPNGQTAILSQRFLYIRNSDLNKLKAVRLFAGAPEKIISDKVKVQAMVFVRAMRP